MKNFLRYSFVALMAMFMGNAFGQEVVFDFTDEANPWGFPTEQFKETGTFTKDGKSIVITTTNYTRWFSDTKALLIGKEGATLTLPAFDFDVAKIEVVGHDGASGKVTHNIFVGDEAVSTEVTGAKGTSSFEIAAGKQAAGTIYVLKVTNANNDQICKINIWKKGAADNPDTPSGSSDLLSLFTIKTGSFSETDKQLLFDFTGEAVLDQSSGAKIEVSGNFDFEFENNICTSNRLSLTFSDEVTPVAASIALSADEGFTDIKVDGKTLSATVKDYLGIPKIVIKSMLKLMLKDEQAGNGTLESPLTPNLANIMAGQLANKSVTDYDVYIKGKVASILYPFDAEHGTATFFISIDGANDFTFECYSVYYLENKSWVEGNTQIKEGDEVIVFGKLTNFNGTPETASKKAYIYSLNGVTKNESGETPDPQPQVTTATCAEVLAGTDGTVYRVTGKCVEIANTIYGNWYLEDATGKIYIYGTLDKEGNAGKNNSIDVWGIEVGDELTVEGERTTFKETVELKNVKVIEIKKAAVEGAKVWDFTKWSDATIANLKADAAASKTSGWSDVEKKADAEAGADPTEASKDNCFWLQLEAAPADGALTANGVVIEELKGLLFTEDATATSRNIAIAVNYSVADASKDFGPYAGGSYLWVGGKDRKFTIPNVAAGSTITMEVESHKITDGRGVKLMQDGNQIGDAFTPKAKESHSWTIENSGDVVVANTNGCHIYKIEVTSGASGIQAVKTVKADNGFIYNLAGQRVDANYKGVVIKDGQKIIQR